MMSHPFISDDVVTDPAFPPEPDTSEARELIKQQHHDLYTRSDFIMTTSHAKFTCSKPRPRIRIAQDTCTYQMRRRSCTSIKLTPHHHQSITTLLSPYLFSALSVIPTNTRSLYHTLLRQSANILG
jgi:hypothetical protein